MAAIDADVAMLVDRALEYVRSRAPRTLPDEFWAHAYGPDRILFRSDGWFQIGAICQHDDQLHSYAIVYHPGQRKLRVQLPWKASLHD